MRKTWPSHWRRRWLRRIKMEGKPTCSSTSVLETLSCHLIPKMRLRHRRWKLFSFFSWAEYVDHASLEYRRVLRTQALYTFIYVLSVRLLLDHTLLLSLDTTTAAFAILFLISGSKEMLELMIDPRYWNLSTTLSSWLPKYRSAPWVCVARAASSAKRASLMVTCLTLVLARSLADWTTCH